jgi:DNA-directed RNA polymerase specialized sigma24 family protein
MRDSDDQRELGAVRGYGGAGKYGFPRTRWTMVQRAGQGSSAALEWLCKAYLEPVHAFIQARGYSRDRAQDLTQEFFAREVLPARKVALLNNVDEKRRFRSWLIGAVRHHLSHMKDREGTQGRGPQPDSLDALLTEPGHGATPESAFLRSWALQVLKRGLDRLEREERERARKRPGELFAALRPLLVGPQGERPEYTGLADRFGRTVNSLKTDVSRLRTRLGDILYSEIADTLADPAEAGEELRFLLRALSPPAAGEPIWDRPGSRSGSRTRAGRVPARPSST